MHVENDDGSAYVYDVPIRPFVLVQHMQVDVTCVNRLANYSLAFARERGWLQTSSSVEEATDFDNDNNAQPLVEQDGYKRKNEDRTVFYAGVDVALLENQPHFRRTAMPSTVMLWSHMHVAHAGRTSYTVAGDLYTYVERHIDHKVPLARFKITCVQVSSTLRVAVPLSSPLRSLLMEGLRRRGFDAEGSLAYRITRLNVPHMLNLSGWFQPSPAVNETAGSEASGVTHTSSSAPMLCLTCPTRVRLQVWRSQTDNPAGENGVGDADDVANVKSPTSIVLSENDGMFVHYSHRCLLRSSDFDFNNHVNQLKMMEMVINAFRAAVCDRGTAYSRLLYSYATPQVSDLLIRQMRIDYVHEVPFTHEAVDVYICPYDERASKQLLSSYDGHRLGELVAISFFTFGVQRIDTSRTVSPRRVPEDKKIDSRCLATAGVLHVIC